MLKHPPNNNRSQGGGVAGEPRFPAIDPRISKRNIPGKGIGYVAQKDIEPGCIIIREKPAFYIPKDEAITSEIFQLLYQVMTSKDAVQIRKFMKLVPLTPENNEQRERVLEEYNHLQKVDPVLYKYFKDNIELEHLLILCYKYIQNAFRIDGYGPCILLTGACLNHSCIPNVVFTNKKGVIMFKTVRKINKGEEICDHYVGLLISESKRRERLKSQYGFECTCLRCLANGKEKQRFYEECKDIQAEKIT